MSGVEQPGSLMRRIEAFYEANPDEWLAAVDMVAKFDCTIDAAEQAVSRLRREGFNLVSMRVYRLMREPNP